ncbi:hypothetical protein PoB_004198700 [Plakobranchus ocellatus]|uniref:Uncharacterized protein n=1 Tax=Plakobranchus ocellatus TaxID=259542 RepID=A0AAV4B8N9_9GAST|nr:hypothetical protein PoB_004198700 [Plakobranchus ocellatus]
MFSLTVICDQFSDEYTLPQRQPRCNIARENCETKAVSGQGDRKLWKSCQAAIKIVFHPVARLDPEAGAGDNQGREVLSWLQQGDVCYLTVGELLGPYRRGGSFLGDCSSGGGYGESGDGSGGRGDAGGGGGAYSSGSSVGIACSSGSVQWCWLKNWFSDYGGDVDCSRGLVVVVGM